MNKVHVIIGLIFLIGLGLTFSLNVSAAAEEDLIPSWIKETAEFWAEDLIDDVTFVNAMEWMIKNSIIVTPELRIVDSSESDDLSDREVIVPKWIKNNARFWSDNQISDSDFLSGITYLYKEEIVKSPNVVVNELNPNWTLGPGDYEFSLTSEGLERKYLVHVPSSYDAIKSTPVVFNFHGGGGSAEGHRDKTNMNENSEKHGYIVVYPNGIPARGFEIVNALNWNSGMNFKGLSQADDVDFFLKMINNLKNQFNIDEKRIYSTGFSNGGQMSYKLACDLPDKIAAIAPVGAPVNIEASCDSSKSTPVMIVHGKKDPCALYEGGVCGGGCWYKSFGLKQSSETTSMCMDVDTVTNNWIAHNGCSDEFKIIYQNDDVECKTFDNCAANSEVMLCTSNTAGHTWPSERPPSKIGVLNDQLYSVLGDVTYDISNDQIWEFFERHSLE